MSRIIGGLCVCVLLLGCAVSTLAQETASSSAASPSAAAQPLAPGTTPVTTAGGTVNKLAKFDAAADVTNSIIFDNGAQVGIGNTSPQAKLDVSGQGIFRGLLNLPAIGAATATGGKNSQPMGWTASAFNSGTGTAVPQNFRWQAEPVGNNTATTSGTLNLLYATGSNTPAETGLKILSNGRFTFASGQTFPGVPSLAAANTFTASQTINGNLIASQLVSTVSTGTPPLSVNSVTQVPGLNATYLDGFTASAFQPLGAYATLGANTFTGNQTVNGTIQSTSGGFEFPDGSVQASATTPAVLDSNSLSHFTVTGTVPGAGAWLFGGATASYVAGPNQVALIWVHASCAVPAGLGLGVRPAYTLNGGAAATLGSWHYATSPGTATANVSQAQFASLPLTSGSTYVFEIGLTNSDNSTSYTAATLGNTGCFVHTMVLIL